MKMFVRRRPPAGFTLLELMITLAIIALLASVASPLAELTSRRAKEQELRVALRTIRSALDRYKQDADEGRIAVDKTKDTGYPHSLTDLVAGVPDQRSPERDKKVYYLRTLPADPMALDNGANPESTWATRSYASPPDNPAPGNDVFDVHSKSTRRGLNGAPYSNW